ncbi:hypothetical protein QNH48_06675 [Neobacillus sp. YX16]|uniref:hypothetical protein n=1 Tax=Neobacillus sp. YX16 TaxID=3047874 RepID=UPI0024C2777E|nr:hypothetical protein [Neobacillus sp. YX16]WHZ04307.1 hypothetical protein QNH48_06675 [Neobacillus sp. YX16]
MSLPSLITGMIDFVALPQKGTVERVAMNHLTIMISAILMFTGSFFIRYSVEVPFPSHFLVLSFFCLGDGLEDNSFTDTLQAAIQ